MHIREGKGERNIEGEGKQRERGRKERKKERRREGEGGSRKGKGKRGKKNKNTFPATNILEISTTSLKTIINNGAFDITGSGETFRGIMAFIHSTKGFNDPMRSIFRIALVFMDAIDIHTSYIHIWFPSGNPVSN